MAALILVCTLCLSACAGSPGAGRLPPEWVGNLESVYPGERFIAARGRGKTRQEAETSALAGIARYFQSEVHTRTASSLSGSSGSGSENKETTLLRGFSEETFVSSEASLFAVRYTAAWREMETKDYVCAAYIDREEAWAVYEPRLRSLAGPFNAAFAAAETESDSLRMFLQYSAALKAASKNGLRPALDFAQALSPRKAASSGTAFGAAFGAVFEKTRKNLAETPQKITDAAALSSLIVVCENDVDSILTTALTGVFAAAGFPVTDGTDGKFAGSARGTHKIEAKIDAGEQKLEAGVFFTPRLTVTISGWEGKAAAPASPVFTWTATVSRQGAKNAELAKRRAWAALAAEVEDGLWAAFAGE